MRFHLIPRGEGRFYSSSLHLASLLLGSSLCVALFAGACKFTSCETTRTCAPTDDEESIALGGGGGDPMQPGETTDGGAGGQGGEAPTTATGGAVGVDGDPCSVGSILCGGVCTDPLFSREHCGASGNCQGSLAGEECLGDEVCSEGACSNDCPEGRLNCEGTCIDPLTDEDFCGAVGACGTKLEAGQKCTGEELCVDAVCRSWGPLSPAVSFQGSSSSTSVQLFSEPDGDATLFWAIPGSVRSSRFSDEEVSWSASATLTTLLLNGAVPSYDMNAAGDAMVAWTQELESPEGDQIFGSLRAGEGAWSSTGQLTTYYFDSTFHGPSARPDVAVDVSGNRFLVRSQGTISPMVHARMWSSESGSWLSSVTLSEEAAEDSVAKVAALDGGEALAVWSELDAGDGVLRSSVVSEDGATEAELVFQEASLPLVSSPRLVSTGASEALVVFFARPDSGSAWQIWGAFYDDGDWDPAEQLGVANNALVQMNATGDAVVVWEANDTIYVTQKESAASDWTAPLPLLTADSSIETPSVAIDPMGNVVVVWSQQHEGDLSAFGIRYDAQEGLWSEPVLLEEMDDPITRPVVALDASGRALVVFAEAVTPWFVRYE